jgi:hypothetical protein
MQHVGGQEPDAEISIESANRLRFKRLELTFNSVNSDKRYRPCRSYPHHIPVRTTTAERNAIRALAGASRVSASRYLVRLAVERKAPPTIEERDELRRVRFLLEMVSNNLNQVAHRLNLSRLKRAPAPSPGEIKAIVEGVKSVTRELRRRLAL